MLIDSNFSRMNIAYYLKNQMPKDQRAFYRILSQNPEYLRNF